MYSTQFLDCGREQADFYSNTPRVSNTRNHTPRFINLRWQDNLNPEEAVVEFFNYSSILPFQQARTFTTRGSFGIYPNTTPDMAVPIAQTIAVPPYAQRFRIRINRGGPLVTNFVPVNNNNMYFYENGMIYQLYSF